MKKFLIGLICFLTICSACLAETVSFNVKSHKIHKLTCQHANCKNCVKMERQQAVKKGGVSCKVCGG